jgi:hypothetical protein
MLRERLWKFHERYIKRTHPEAHVFNAKIRLTKYRKQGDSSSDRLSNKERKIFTQL